MILTAVFFRPVRKLSLNTERKSDGDAKAAVNLLLNLLLNTFWIFILYGKAVGIVEIFSRIFKNLLMLPLEIAALFIILKAITKLIQQKKVTIV